MKTLILIIVPLILIKAQLFAQDFATVGSSSYDKSMPKSSKNIISYEFEVYNYVPDEITKVSDDMAGKHFLGNEIAKKMYLFDEAYTYTEAIAPGNPATRTMFKKPLIYSSVIKIEKLLKKNVKSKDLTLDEATVKFNKVLDVALNIKGLNTDKFEGTIKAQGNNASDLLSLFLQVHLSYTNN